MGEAYFNQFMPLRYQLVISAGMFGKEENFSLALIPTKFKKQGWAPESGSQGDWRSGPSKLQDLC